MIDSEPIKLWGSDASTTLVWRLVPHKEAAHLAAVVLVLFADTEEREGRIGWSVDSAPVPERS